MSRRASSRLTVKDAMCSISDKENKSQPQTPKTATTPLASKSSKSTTPKSRSKKPIETAKTPTAESTIPATPDPRKSSSKRKKEADTKEESDVKLEDEEPMIASPPGTKGKRLKRSANHLDDEDDELPHNMGKRPPSHKVKKEEDDTTGDVKPPPPKAKRTPKSTKTAEQDQEKKEIISGATQPPKKKPKKANPYGLTPGETPFPNWPHPTPSECQTVHDLLLNSFPASRRQNFGPPSTIPAPSEVMAGCGEVPSILDALIRTLLSAATTGKNSSTSFQGLISRFGRAEGGVGKGSVNWNAVHEAPMEDVVEAIKHGGLAVNKSKNIKRILEMVHAENKERLAVLEKAEASGEIENEPDPEEKAEKEVELRALRQGYLTLDYYHHLEKDDAMTTFTKLPGIGVKTAACVNMFCMQRPCFAVDTHVFRLCQYLGWVPSADAHEKGQKKVDRDTTFSHCEVRVPDHLKYTLHQLFIAHGKACPRCRAITGENSEGWADASCPIEHLVKRLGAKKGGLDSPAKKGPKKNAKGKKDESEEESEEDEAMGEDHLEAAKPVSRKAPRRKAATPVKPGKAITQPSSSRGEKTTDSIDESEEEGEDAEMSDFTDESQSSEDEYVE